jgi:hypothetical protein
MNKLAAIQMLRATAAVLRAAGYDRAVSNDLYPVTALQADVRVVPIVMMVISDGGSS